ATNDFGLYIDVKEELDGVPEDVLTVAREAAASDARSGWKLTLRMPCFQPVMQYASHRALRERLHHAYATRASEFGKPEWDNTAIMQRILALRRESALLLGYDTFAEVSLVPKMAGSPAEVLAFLRDLASRARPYAE